MKRLAFFSTFVLLASLVMTGTALAVPPDNDVYGGRIPVALGDSISQDTSEATTDADDDEINAQCGAPVTDASVWFEYTAAVDGFVVIDVSASDYSAGVLVATGGPGDFAIQSCAPGATFFFASAGETYAILAIDDQFDGGGNGGNLELNVVEIPPPPEISLTVNKTGRFDSRTGAAIIGGTVSCTGGPADFSFIEVFVRQQVGRFFIDGFGFLEGFNCDGTTQPWTVEVLGFSGLFKGGKALSVTFAVACGQFLCGVDFQEHVVQLRGGRR